MPLDTPTIPTIRKIEQFEDFLKVLENGISAHWVEIAELIGVDQDTITSWKQHPLAKEARAKGVERCLAEMERAGRQDWRMWEAKLKLLGLQAPQKVDVSASVNTGKYIIYKPEKLSEGYGRLDVNENKFNAQSFKIG